MEQACYGTIQLRTKCRLHEVPHEGSSMQTQPASGHPCVSQELLCRCSTQSSQIWAACGLHLTLSCLFHRTSEAGWEMPSSLASNTVLLLPDARSIPLVGSVANLSPLSFALRPCSSRHLWAWKDYKYCTPEDFVHRSSHRLACLKSFLLQEGLLAIICCCTRRLY